jgi:uncharacterized protein (DUF305 family)
MSRRYLALPFVFLVLAAFVACNGDSSRESRTGAGTMTGPGGMPGQGGGPGMTGGMGGSGMSMTIASEFDYLTQMIPHHEEAIVAARLLRVGTARSEMRRFAESIISTQAAEVAQMKRWLNAWYPGRDTTVTYQPMMRDLSGLRGDALDHAFLQDMIPHHMMAVMMSQQLLNRRLAEHRELTPFAESIRDTQTAEVRTMQQWLRDWF